MGFQMRIRSCVPQRPQVPPPPRPQVQILWRRHAQRGLREGERERNIAIRKRYSVEIRFFSFSSFLCFFARIPTLLGFCKVCGV